MRPHNRGADLGFGRALHLAQNRVRRGIHRRNLTHGNLKVDLEIRGHHSTIFVPTPHSPASTPLSLKTGRSPERSRLRLTECAPRVRAWHLPAAASLCPPE